jgi:hypothetical protein
MRTHTKFFNFSKLARADGASTVVRVAMVCNDLAIANSVLGHFKNLSANALSHVRQGGALYFVRMSCGHLREGIRAIQEIGDDVALSALVTRCDAAAQSAFGELHASLVQEPSVSLTEVNSKCVQVLVGNLAVEIRQTHYRRIRLYIWNCVCR